jgi:hypothetical protein
MAKNSKTPKVCVAVFDYEGYTLLVTGPDRKACEDALVKDVERVTRSRGGCKAVHGMSAREYVADYCEYSFRELTPGVVDWP